MNVLSAASASVAVFLLATVCVAPGHAQSSSPPREVAAPHVSVSLVADPAAPANAPRVGLRFALDPGWHVYWRNPGDSGGPPSVRWTQLPAGWSAGDLLWPVPERIPLGPIVNYGYTGDVVLPVTMNVVPQGKGTGPARLVADVRWLVCHDICVPGRATLGLPWPLPESDRGAAGDWARVIADARRQVPSPAPPAWQVSARDAGDSIVVTVKGDAKVGRGVFFPIAEGVIEESAPQKVEASGGVVTFTLKKSDQLTTTPKELRGVVKFDSGVAYEVAARFGR
jgi:thiol:disulfide interchange protein DsbD